METQVAPEMHQRDDLYSQMYIPVYASHTQEQSPTSGPWVSNFCLNSSDSFFSKKDGKVLSVELS